MKTKSPSSDERGDRAEQQHLNAWLKQLSTDGDREALRLLALGGFLCWADPARLSDAVGRLWDHEEFDQKVSAAGERIEAAGLTEEQSQPVNELDDLRAEEIAEITDAAYLLGIAVGRRLGLSALSLPARV
jgi:hypothetical protein